MRAKQELIKLKETLREQAKKGLIQSNDLLRSEDERQRLKTRATAFLEIVEIIDKMIAALK